MSEYLHQDEESVKDIDAFDDTDADTPTKGNDSNKDDKSDSMSDEAFLKKVNEVEGRNYKSIDAYKKTIKERNNAFAQKPNEKEGSVKTESTPQNSVVKNLYFKANPEAEGYWENVVKEASRLKTDPFELYENSDYLKGEAKALAVKEGNAGKVGSPSSMVDGKVVSDEDKMSKKFNKNLPPGFSEF